MRKGFISLVIIAMILAMMPQNPIKAEVTGTPSDEDFENIEVNSDYPRTVGDWAFSLFNNDSIVEPMFSEINVENYQNDVGLSINGFPGFVNTASIKSKKGTFKLLSFRIENALDHDLDFLLLGYKNGQRLPDAIYQFSAPSANGPVNITPYGSEWNNIDEFRITRVDEVPDLFFRIFHIDVDPAVEEPIPVPLEKVLTPVLALSGTANWTAVQNASGYKVQLYKDGNPIGAAQNTTSPQADFVHDIRNGGLGSYSVKVTALGDGETYIDGIESDPSNTVELIKLPTLTDLSWNGMIAKWENITLAYDVQLYKDGQPLGSTITVGENSNDFANEIKANGTGTYTFKVMPLGYGPLVLDGETSEHSIPYTDEIGSLSMADKTAQAGETVNIPVVLSKGNEPVAIKFNVGFDTNKLEFIGIQNSTVDNTGLILGHSDPQDNGDIISLGGTSNNTSITDGEVAILEFKVKDGVAGGQEALVNLSGIEVSDIDGKASRYSNFSGKISIEKNNNADLKGLTLSEDLIINEDFKKDNLNYSVTIPRDMQLNSFTVSPIADYSRSTITVNGNALTNGQTSFPVIFDGNHTEVTIVVTSESGNSSKTYTVSVTKEAPKSSNASLGRLSLTDEQAPIVDFSNELANGKTTFTYAMSNPTKYEVEVNGLQSDTKATVAFKVNEVNVPSPSVTLKPGLNKIEVTVTAEDGVTVKTYTILLTLGLKGDADLDGDVDINDWQMVARFLLHKSTPHAQATWNSDLNDNGEVSINDWVGIANILLGNDTSK